ncbi:uncharacterized protein J4E78_005882 [Alternaria triticimaculans]|uniref:uncharacterized protein n=1 Tax=Alternaria triticimaculans TaxID=297637 RepID=UPI0020C58E79|nr:uncharacterized protein J4E78_005882 [Alternaria triticimaculans]KAI4659454.1 hypothetical protein J4E78_005882 [Alternaria triticimaculans]
MAGRLPLKAILRLLRWALSKAMGKRLSCLRDTPTARCRLKVGTLVITKNPVIIPAIQTAATALDLSGLIRKPDFRERSPPRESFPSNSSYRDRAPPNVHPAREAPSQESATERMAKMLAQRKAERGPSSVQVAQSPTQAQGAQNQVQPDMERRFQKQEQRLQTATTAIATLQQEVTAANTRYEQLKTAHLALMQQVCDAARNAAIALSVLAPRAHIATPAEPLRSNAQQPFPDEGAGYQSNDMLSGQEAESLQSAPGIGQRMAPGFRNVLTSTGEKSSPFQPSSPGTRTRGGFTQPPGPTI